MSLLRDRVLPPTHAAGRFPSRVPAGPEGTWRLAHTLHTAVSFNFAESHTAVVVAPDREIVEQQPKISKPRTVLAKKQCSCVVQSNYS